MGNPTRFPRIRTTWCVLGLLACASLAAACSASDIPDPTAVGGKADPFLGGTASSNESADVSGVWLFDEAPAYEAGGYRDVVQLPVVNHPGHPLRDHFSREPRNHAFIQVGESWLGFSTNNYAYPNLVVSRLLSYFRVGDGNQDLEHFLFEHAGQRLTFHDLSKRPFSAVSESEAFTHFLEAFEALFNKALRELLTVAEQEGAADWFAGSEAPLRTSSGFKSGKSLRAVFGLPDRLSELFAQPGLSETAAERLDERWRGLAEMLVSDRVPCVREAIRQQCNDGDDIRDCLASALLQCPDDRYPAALVPNYVHFLRLCDLAVGAAAGDLTNAETGWWEGQ